MNQPIPDAEPRVLGQLLTAHSAFSIFSDKQRMGEFIQRTVEGVPGVSSCGLCLRGGERPRIGAAEIHECDACAIYRAEIGQGAAGQCLLSNRPDFCVFPLDTQEAHYGFLLLWLENDKPFAPYKPFVNNLANSLALNAERRWQKQQLEAANAELLKLRDHLQDLVEKRTAALETANDRLRKRIKEIGCIADISRLAEELVISIEKFVQEVVSLLPPAWQYPEICGARITMDSKEFKTANFRETEWSQSADINVDRMKFGAVTVCYLEEKPEADEGPFLKEERSLINTVADFLGHIIQHRRTEVEIRDSETRFRTIFDSANDGMLLADMEGKKFHSGNAAIYRMLGYSQEEIKKMGITDIHPEKDIPHVIEQFEKQTRKEIAIAQSLPMKRKDGSVFYADISSAPVEISGKRYLLGIFRDITERKQAEEQLKKSLQQTKKVLEDVVLTLSSIVEKRDPYTAGHQRRVADLACAIAGELNLPEVQIEGIRVAGIVHDIGKINVPAEILSKTGRLSEAEFNIIKTHAQVGKEILEPIDFPWPVAQVVHQHHERLNGTGYPQGLSDGKIILEAKIMAVADVVEAMASHRPYRPALGIEKALEEISSQSSILYDPQVADACRELFDKKGYELVQESAS